MSNLLLVFWSVKQRFRKYFLAAITLGLGVASIASGLSIIEGYQIEIEKITFGAYSRSLILKENKSIHDLYGAPRVLDGKRIEVEIKGVESVIYRREADIEVKYERSTRLTKAVGFLGPYQIETGTKLLWGKRILENKQSTPSRECTLGFRLAVKLGLHNWERQFLPSILINNVRCKVIGVFAEPKSRIEEYYGFSVITSLDFLTKHIENKSHLNINEVDQITIVFSPSQSLKKKEIETDKLMRKNHGIPQSHNSGFTYSDENFPLQILKRQRRLVASILLFLGIFTTIVSVIGFAVIWVNMIAERKFEIATQFAVGASVRDILFQLIVEVFIISIAGVVMGLIFTVSLIGLLSSYLDIPTSIPLLQTVLLAFAAIVISILVVVRSISATASMPLAYIVS